jgi:hypothetical protein
MGSVAPLWLSVARESPRSTRAAIPGQDTLRGHEKGRILLATLPRSQNRASLDCRCLELYVLTSETLVTFAVCVAGRPSRQ